MRSDERDKRKEKRENWIKRFNEVDDFFVSLRGEAIKRIGD